MTGTTPTMTFVREVMDRDFQDEVEKSPEPTVVIFVSDACPHCQMLMPYVEGFVRDFRGRVRFVTTDIVANPWTAERNDIRGTPTFKFFCHGRLAQDLVGLIPPAAIKHQVEECVRKSTEIDYEITGYG